MLRVGRVQSNVDNTAGGILKIKPLDSTGDVIDEEFDAVPCSPNLGEGYGFLSVPGKGATVIFMEIPPIVRGVDRGQVTFRHAWIGVVATDEVRMKGQAAFSNDKNDPDESNNTQKDVLGQPGYPEKTKALTIPEGENMYAENGIPQQDIFKSKHGHKLVLSHKITETGVNDNGILLQTASGKGLHINDGPPELKMDRITLRDEQNHGVRGERGANRFEIISYKDQAELVTEKDQLHITHSGNQEHMIMCGEGTQYRINRGKGNIQDIAAYGNHQTNANKNIASTSHTGNIIEFAQDGDIQENAPNGRIISIAGSQLQLVCGDSSLTMLPGSVEINSPSISLNGQAISLAGGPISLNGEFKVDTAGFATLATGVGLENHVHAHGEPTTGPPQGGAALARGSGGDDDGDGFDTTQSRVGPAFSSARRAPAASEVSTSESQRTTETTRAIKLFVISIGQSNNGLLEEPGPLTSEDLPDPAIFELSQGIEANRYKHYVAPAGERHVFNHPAQDDLGGICMRLPAAKEIRRLYASIVPEITIYCGAKDGTSLSAGVGEWETSGYLTQQAISFCNTFMIENPDYTPVFWCSLGASDAISGMPNAEFSGALAGLADQLRSNIHNAENAFWVQCDMPQSLVSGVDDIGGNGTGILTMQQSAPQFISNSGTATMNDLIELWDGRHITRDELRTLGRRVAASMSSWLASVALADN
jgi:hypothetical protein